MLTPGRDLFDPSRGRDEVRIAYVLECPKIVESTEILGKALASYQEKHPERIAAR